MRLRSQQGSLTTLGLVDSGSTNVFLPTEIAEILGLTLDPATAQPSVGAGGGFKCVVCRVDVELLKGGNPFATFENFGVLVPTNPDAIPYVILGRDSVFMKFDVTFRERMQRTVLRPSRVKVKKSRFERRY